VGLLDRLFGRRSRGTDAPAPTRDDTLSSTSVQADQGWVAPPDPDITAVDEPAEADPGVDADVSGGDTADTGGGDGGGDGGGGNGGGGD
jgi:hypothetical protein